VPLDVAQGTRRKQVYWRSALRRNEKWGGGCVIKKLEFPAAVPNTHHTHTHRHTHTNRYELQPADGRQLSHGETMSYSSLLTAEVMRR